MTNCSGTPDTTNCTKHTFKTVQSVAEMEDRCVRLQTQIVHLYKIKGLAKLSFDQAFSDVAQGAHDQPHMTNQETNEN